MERIDSVELVRTAELSFVMDEETSPNLQTTFYDEASGYYYIHNTITGYIERFHTDSTVKSPVRTKISGIPWGINVVSSDSIYLLDLYNDKKNLSTAKELYLVHTPWTKHQILCPEARGCRIRLRKGWRIQAAPSASLV